MYHVSMCYTFNAIFLLAYVWLTVVVIDCNTWCIFRRSGYISFVLSYQYPCDIERVPNPVSDVICIYVAGEPFINGEAVPYDPKYHEEWVRNNARANERSRCNDRPRNFERRRENMQNFQNRDAPPGQGFNNPPLPFQPGIQPRDAGAPLPPPPQNAPMHHAQSNMPPPPQNAGAPPTYQPHAHRQVMHQAHVATKVALLAMKVAIKVTKVGLVATCRVAQLLPIRATLDIMVDQDTQVATCLCLRSKVVANPLSKVATHLLTKVVIKTMVAQQATKASQATRAITAQIYRRMRGGMELGVITSRTLLEEKMCRSKYGLNSVVFFLFSEALSAYISWEKQLVFHFQMDDLNYVHFTLCKMSSNIYQIIVRSQIFLARKRRKGIHCSCNVQCLHV
jgi:hypothetical protein